MTLFRRQDGTAVALEDRCPHRGYPLSAGRVVDDAIECGYHGFTFDCDGVCTRVPAQDIIPRRTFVRSFPIVEKDGWIWIWTGDAANGRPRDGAGHALDDRPRAGRRSRTRSRSPAAPTLIHDNLLDLTHESFIHLSTVGDDYIYQHGITVVVDGDVVSADRLMPGVDAPPLYASHDGTHRVSGTASTARSSARRATTCCTPGSPVRDGRARRATSSR